MPQHDTRDDDFQSSDRFLSPSKSFPRKSPSRQSIHNRKSNSSLRSPSGLAHTIDGDAANGRHSLAHELAVALMPEPSSGSKLLAEEFGIEYDEGAEGIDDHIHRDGDVEIIINGVTQFSDELGSQTMAAAFHDTIPSNGDHVSSSFDLVSDTFSSKNQKKPRKLEQDAMEILAQDLESTDKFLVHLRRLDADPGSSIVQQPALERIASDIIRRINDTARDREGQVRELLECEREFRKIAGEIGGSDVLGQLEELTQVDDLLDTKTPLEPRRAETRHFMDAVVEEDESVDIGPSHMGHSHDWEMDPDRRHLHLGDEEDEPESVASPVKDSFPPPPLVDGPLTPAKTIPQLADLRSFTTSLVTSLATISEQAQVNGAATTEAGRKIRALKNKLGGWRTEWDSAERSRVKIDRWEAGIVDGGETDGSGLPTPTRLVGVERVDGRRVVEEHLHAFELALADAARKTQAIMAS